MLRIRQFTLFIIFLVFSMPVVADVFDDGLAAYRKNDYQAAAKLWTSRELENDKRAIFNLGRLHMTGRGVEKNFEKGAELYRSAAEKGHLSAQFNLGLAYLAGRGVEKNISKAKVYWEQAAFENHGPAQYNLAALLWGGKGVKRDQATAMKWFRRAFANGNKESSKFLSSLFEPMYNELKDDHELQRPVESDRTISLIEEMGTFKLAQQALENGAFEQAYKYWFPLAEDGHNASQFMLGQLYEKGQGISSDFDTALSWYEKAAKSGQADAQFRIGMYFMNEASEINQSLGRYWIQSAADNKHQEAIEFMDSGG